MSNVSPPVLAVIALTLVAMFTFWVVWVRAMWVFVKAALFFGTATVGGFLAVWAWRTVHPA